jgi:polysaccharide chain length determinant protein (PEP-CTERM system associated)
MAPNEPLLDQLRVVWNRRRWLAVLCFLFPFTLALSVIVFLPNIYRSTALILVDRQQVPEAFVRPTVTSGLEVRLQTIAQQVLSRARLQSVVDQFRLYERLRQHVSAEEVIQRMRQDITVEYRGTDRDRDGQRGTVAFAVSFRGQDPRVVAQVTNTLASFFVEENLKARERQATATTEFLRVQLEDVKKRLDAQEKLVSQFKRRHLVELPQQMEMNLAMIERLDAQLRLNVNNQTRLAERREALARRALELGSLDTPSGRAVAAAPRDPLAEELLRMQQELRQLRSRYSDRYPDVVRLKAAIADLERQMAERGEVVAETGERGTGEPGPARALAAHPQLLQVRLAQEELEAELRALKAEEKRLRDSLAVYLARVQNAPRLEQEFKEVSRDYESTRELYASLTKRYEEAQLAESMEQRQKGEQFRILDPAVPSEEPVAPHRWRLALMALVASLGLAAGVVIAVERIRPVFHSLEALRAYAPVPVLVSIPVLVSPAEADRRRRRVRLAAVGVVAVLLLVVGASYLIAHGNEYLVSLMIRGRS